jgi:hypothetical protein
MDLCAASITSVLDRVPPRISGGLTQSLRLSRRTLLVLSEPPEAVESVAEEGRPLLDVTVRGDHDGADLVADADKLVEVGGLVVTKGVQAEGVGVREHLSLSGRFPAGAC